MTHLSDKEMLEKLKELPAHELNGDQKNRIIHSIRKQKAPKRKFSFSFQRAGVLAAILSVLIIAPILVLENKSEPENHLGGVVERAESGEYFALLGQDGKPVYPDSNFGIPGRVSLLSPPEWIAGDGRSVAKIMVYLWWKPGEQVYQNMKVEAVHVDTGFTQKIASFPLNAGIYGSDAHALTSFKPFEKHGIWNLKFMFGERTFEEFSIYVKESYVKMGDSTLMISQEDLVAGTFKNVKIEVEGEDLPEQVELELFSFEDGTTEVFLFSGKTDYIKADSGKKVSMYTGDIVFNKSGRYRLGALKQSVPIEVRKPVDEED
ncbi:hypothetical protein J7I93_24810 [Bacillus sp. ISL-47]|nr:hypothetical protein [Bacillus sp. ISL-47]